MTSRPAAFTKLFWPFRLQKCLRSVSQRVPHRVSHLTNSASRNPAPVDTECLQKKVRQAQFLSTDTEFHSTKAVKAAFDLTRHWISVRAGQSCTHPVQPSSVPAEGDSSTRLTANCSLPAPGHLTSVTSAQPQQLLLSHWLPH